MRLLRVVVWLPFMAACTDGSLEPQPLAASRSALIDDTWVALPAPEPQLYDLFGWAAALDGERALIGIPGRDQADDLDDDSGSARLFLHTEDGWQAGDELSADQRTPLSNLGSSVALRGSSAAIGNGYASVANGSDAPYASAGLVYAFRHLPSGWQSQRLEDPELAAERLFGAALAAFDEEIVVGAPSTARPGSAYVYQWSARDGWVLKQELTPPPNTAEADDHFGWAIAGDEATLLIGAPGDLFEKSGAAYIYERDEAGLWQHVDTLRGEHSPAVPGDGFGYSVALLGKQALVGASGDFFTVAPVAYLFEQALGTWPDVHTHQFKLASPIDFNDEFATSVGLGKDSIWIGAPNQMGGVVYPFQLLNNGKWDDQQPLSPSQQDYERFGTSIATLGRSALLGSPKDHSTGGEAFLVTQSNGSACERDFDCASRHCVEGICCDTRCDAGCYSCRAAEKDSGGDGECGPISASVPPPDGDCSAEAPTSCGRTGMCDGRGECLLHSSKTLCAEASCRGIAAWVPERYCDGFGACAPGSIVSCGRLSCSAEGCAPCTNDAACQASDFCGADGCEKKRELASACSDDRECESGWCPDGHCVNGPECSEDATEMIAVDGEPTPCHPYLCADASCLAECIDSADCQAGFACSARRECTPIPKARSKTASSCGYAAGTESTGLGWAVLAGFVAMTCGAWRPRRRGRHAAHAKDGAHGLENT